MNRSISKISSRRAGALPLLASAAALLAVVAWAASAAAQTYPCSASTSSLVLRSAGGVCADGLALGEHLTLTYRITNQSIVDAPGDPMDGTPVIGEVFAGSVLEATLAEGAAAGTLAFVPVCPNGSTGPKMEGDECDPAADPATQCGVGIPCGCLGNCGCFGPDTMTCAAHPSDPNKVLLTVNYDMPFAALGVHEIAKIRVKVVQHGLVAPGCGMFMTRMDSQDFLMTNDPLCDAQVSAGAQASAELHAPECLMDADCGDPACNTCMDAGTANHCVAALQDAPCADDGNICTDDYCDEDAGGQMICIHPDNDNPACEADICRSPGYWATHSGYEKKNSINVGQMVIDAVGPLEVCGQTITATSKKTIPYLSGLGLSSDLEALCVKGEGVKERNLYRQLVAAALNCAMSGADCDSVTGKYIDVKFSDCSEVCAGNPPPNAPSIGKCAGQLDCFNNGGRIVDGECVAVPNGCHTQPMCNPAIGLCPGDTPASSPRACNEARGNDCTIDSCN